jgi:predicted ATPase/class 3 adenylate cyclase
LLRQQTPALDLVERRTLVHDPPVTRELPAGTVTFLFTDVEGSTRLLHALGADAYADALATHRRLLRDAFDRHGGVEVDTQGDAFFVAFPTAPGALAAAREATEALSTGPIRVRIGLHTGTPLLTDEGYVGADVHRAARIAAAGHGGQILISAATAALLDPDELRDLGAHRLKDLSAPERIFQADGDEHPPLKTLHQTNLPVPATAFLGRESEVADVARLLTRADVRLVTLTGPGGTGKTRLALQAAASVADSYPGGVWWVPLAALRDPALVLESAAKAIGAADDLADHIGDKRLLLLFDNFEHLSPAADDLGALAAKCPNLTLLVTSREPLHLAGEHEFGVDPLEPAAAVELFLTRAMAVNREIQTNGEVARICERLDHLPLAIELAAARVKILSTAALLQRLERRLPVLAGGSRDAPERQRTLRATIEWSHELLSSDEQRLFGRLAVFRGGCTLEAAEEVADADLDTLQSLVDKSLVRVRGDRFWMLETIREFALERLDAADDADALRDRHARHFLSLAEAAEPHLRGNPKAWTDRLEADLDNLRAAQDRFAERGDELEEIRLVAALWRLWMLRGHFAEGERRLEVVRRGAAAGTRARASAVCGLTAISMARNATAVATTAANEALDLHTQFGDRWGIANSTFLLGHVAAEAGEFARGRDLFIEALAAFRAEEDSHYTLLALRNQAWMEYELGNQPGATALHEEVVELARAAGNPRMEASSLGALAEYRILDGRPNEGLPLLVRSTRMFLELAERIEVTINLRRFALALVNLHQTDTAIRLLGAADAADEEMGAGRAAWVRDLEEAAVAMAARGMDEATLARVRDEGRRLTLADAFELAVSSVP